MERRSLNITGSMRCCPLQIEIEKPIGFKFTRGNDGGCYVINIDPAAGNTVPDMEVGDKILKVR